MKKIVYLMVLCLLCTLPLSAMAQRVTDGSYRTVAHIKGPCRMTVTGRWATSKAMEPFRIRRTEQSGM